MNDLVRWLRAQLDEDVRNAYQIGGYLATNPAPDLFSPAAAGRHARFMVEKAELKKAIFEKTVFPYLGLEDPSGHVAEQQARMAAAMYADRPGYREEWRL